MFLSRFGIHRPLMVFMIFVGVIVLGMISLANLKIDLFPEMNFPMIAVITSYPGVGPKEIESMVTKPIEGVLATVTDVKNVNSKALQELSVVMMEFEWGTDMDAAATNTREKLDLVKQALPDGIQNPMIFKFDPSMMPVLFLGVSGAQQGLDELRTLAEDTICQRLARINGVAVAAAAGGLQREIQIRLYRNRLEGMGISLEQLKGALAAANLDLPGGHLKIGDTDYIVRTNGVFKTVSQIGAVVIANQRGVPIRLKDVAEIKDDFEEKTSVVKINGRPGVLVQIQKASSSNTVQVVQRVRVELKRLQADLPPGVKIVTIMDAADEIEKSINTVKQEVVLGGVLAVILILVFLGNWRSTFIISLAIPISIIATFALLYFNKMTLNIVTLGGLALGVGRLVDDAIVVLENIYRHMQAGERPREASLLGASEVSNAVIAATVTTIVVFVPIFFVSGLAGIIFKPMAYTVSFSLFASLFVALLLIPVLTSKFLKVEMPGDTPAKLKAQAPWLRWFSQWHSRFAEGLEKVTLGYERILEKALLHRRRVILWTLGAAVASLFLIPFIGMEFIPEADAGAIAISFKLPIGTRLETSEKILAQVEDLIQKNVPEIRDNFSRIGIEGKGMGSMASVFGGITGSHAGQMRIQLVKKNARRRTTDQILEALRPKLAAIPGIDIKMSKQQGMGGAMGNAAPIQVEIQGYDLDIGRRLAKQVAQMIEKVNGARDVEISREEGLPEMQIAINRQRAAELGLSVAQAAAAIETAMAGKVASIYRDPLKGKEYNIWVQYRKQDRLTMADLERVMVMSPSGIKIPIANLAAIERSTGPVTIDRKNQERLITINAQVSGRAPGDVAAEIQRRIRSEITVPNEFIVKVAGTYQDMMDAFVNLLFALGLAILLIYMVLVAQFESLLDPFVIMFAVPLGVVGVIWGLFLTGHTLSTVSFLGIIMMVGIVVSNSILPVDYTNILRRRGKPLRAAVVEAGRTRLRPILMTTLTTILGMLPMALGLGEGGETEAPMAVAVIFGLSLSTILTLVIIPVIYTWVEERLRKVRPKRNGVQV
jgi:HAE1 family hydrophobic/amphiphilic exporter-1